MPSLLKSYQLGELGAAKIATWQQRGRCNMAKRCKARGLLGDTVEWSGL
jgi:hypothetical protein